MYVDAHSHLDKYTNDELGGVLEAIERDRILTLSVSVDGPSFVRTEGIATRSELVVPCFGVHPEEATRYVGSLGDIREFAERSPIFGEIGLDYRTVTDERLHPAQREVFEWFLDLARAQDKMISVHCAGAEQDAADLLARYESIRAIVHWYSGPLDVLDRMIDAGLMFSVGVEVLHSDHIRNVTAAIPTDQLLTETDNPGGPRWLTGDTGYPHLISDVVDVLSDIRGVSRDDLLAAVRSNLNRLIESDDHLTPWRGQLRS
jgi:TatD DNase family protein